MSSSISGHSLFLIIYFYDVEHQLNGTFEVLAIV